MPPLRWDFAQCASLEEMWFSDAQMLSFRADFDTMERCERESCAHCCVFLAERTRKAGKRVQTTQESETLWSEIAEFVCQLEYGPARARAWLSFLDVKDVVPNMSDESSDFESDVSGGGVPFADVLQQEGERALAMKEEWLSKIIPGEKTMELRNKSAQPGLAWFSVPNHIYLRANIVQTELLTAETFRKLRGKHCWAGEQPYEKTRGWWLENIERLQDGVPFQRRCATVVRFKEVDAEEEDGSPLAKHAAESATHLDKSANAPDVGGLSNVGNTCFVNSVLQTLCYSRAVEDHLGQHQCLNSGPAACVPLARNCGTEDKRKADAVTMRKWQRFWMKRVLK